MKSDSPEIDLFRVHSPSTQLLSYAMEVGKLYQNKTVMDNLRLFAEKDEKGNYKNPEAAEFIAKLFPEKGESDIVNSILGIKSYDADSAGIAKEMVGKATRVVSGSILAGKIKTALQPILSTVPKGVILSIAQWSKGNSGFVNPTTFLTKGAGIKPEVHEALASNGFLPDYQAFDTSMTSKIGKGFNDVVAESS